MRLKQKNTNELWSVAQTISETRVVVLHIASYIFFVLIAFIVLSRWRRYGTLKGRALIPCSFACRQCASKAGSYIQHVFHVHRNLTLYHPFMEALPHNGSLPRYKVLCFPVHQRNTYLWFDTLYSQHTQGRTPPFFSKSIPCCVATKRLYLSVHVFLEVIVE